MEKLGRYEKERYQLYMEKKALVYIQLMSGEEISAHILKVDERVLIVLCEDGSGKKTREMIYLHAIQKAHAGYIEDEYKWDNPTDEDDSGDDVSAYAGGEDGDSGDIREGGGWEQR